MINHACPLIVLDDERDELWAVTQGLGTCGLPAIPHLIDAGKLVREPPEKYAGVRFLFTDLHVLGGGATKLEQHVAALAKFIQTLMKPTCYVLIFWSKYQDEVVDAQKLLSKYLPTEYAPFAYETLAKEDAKNAADQDENVAGPASVDLCRQIKEIVDRYPQLKAIMNWEASVSKAAVETTNRLVASISKKTKDGECSFTDHASVRAVLARMAQEALGLPHAPNAPTKGLTLALIPILQDLLERTNDAGSKELRSFLSIADESPITLPHAGLNSLLNDFFIHAESADVPALDRGSVIRLSDEYLTNAEGFSRDIGLSDIAGDWKESICREFVSNWKEKVAADRDNIKKTLATNSVYAVELSADCDYAQNKQRTQRFMLALFVPSEQVRPTFYSKSKDSWANESIYSTPEITLGSICGRLLISCRVFIAKPHGIAVEGEAVTRLRKDVIDEISHVYTSHMRRPGKIAFGH